MMNTTKGYKAFKKGLKCRNKQYAENTVFEEDKAVPCECGMHYVINPLDALKYYPLIDDNGDITEFAEVEALDEPVTDNDKKYCTTRLKIGTKLSFNDFVKASVNFILKKESEDNETQMASSGNGARMASSGNSAQMVSSGDDSIVCGTGSNCMAKAKKGSWITLAEWGWNDTKNAPIPICVKTVQVDGETIKEDTFYTLKNGEFVEAY